MRTQRTQADVAKVEALLVEAADRNPGVLLQACAPELTRLLQVLKHESVEGTRQMQVPADSGPIPGEAIAQRAMKICGCKGQHDCSCVTVLNQARQELWSEHNRQALAPAAGCSGNCGSCPR